MEFVANRKSLVQLISYVVKASSNKSPIRSFEGIKLTLDHSGLTIKGSDGEVTITCHLDPSELEIITNGQALVNGKYLHEITGVLSGDKVTFEIVEENLLKIRDARSEFSIHTMLVDEYPEPEPEAIGEIVTLESAMMKTIIRQTVFAVPNKEIRPVLMGVSFRIRDGLLECAASDTYRLTIKTIPIKEKIEHETIIPVKCLNILQGIMGDGEVCISFGSKSVTFIQGTTVVMTKIINGPFPEVRRLIPETHTHTLAIKAPAIMQAIERAALMYRESSSAVKMEMSSSKIDIFSHNQEVGYAHEQLDGGIFVGEPFKLTFNPIFILEAIRAIDNEDITFYFAGDMKPFIIKNENDSTLTQVILPLRG